MDLNTVKKNLANNSYETVESCLADIELIWDNCKAYNNSDTVTRYQLSGYISKPRS